VSGAGRKAAPLTPAMVGLNADELARSYEAFPPERARRITERLEIHPTTKH
jgi:hypothetical protein